MSYKFLFSIGIENSAPTINNGKTRVDEMERCGHYKHWRKDFDPVQELGIGFLRYGLPLPQTFLAPNKFDWNFADVAFSDLRQRKILPIADLVQFRSTRLDRQFSKSEFPPIICRIRLQFCKPISLDTMTNEHRISADATLIDSGEIFGYHVITSQYYDRYRLPVMPWYSLTDQVGWHTALRENNGNVDPVGRYDLNRNIRPVGKAYKQLIEDWKEVLPTQSICLTVPIVYEEAALATKTIVDQTLAVADFAL